MNACGAQNWPSPGMGLGPAWATQNSGLRPTNGALEPFLGVLRTATLETSLRSRGEERPGVQQSGDGIAVGWMGGREGSGESTITLLNVGKGLRWLISSSVPRFAKQLEHLNDLSQLN